MIGIYIHPQMFNIPQEYITGFIALISSAFTGLITYSVSKNKQRSDDKLNSQNELEYLIKANSDFRLELKKDLEQAKADIRLSQQRIEMLESQLNAKDKTIAELTAKVLVLAAEVKRLGGIEYDFSKLS